MHNLFRQLIKKCARVFGAEIVGRETARYWERQSLPGVLAQIARSDVQIKTVIDVGAAHGDWSVMCSHVLPEPRYVLLEPLSEYKPLLTNSLRRITRAEHHAIGVDRESGDRCIHVHPDLVGSSFYLEDEDSDVNGTPRIIPVDTLDAICAAHRLEPPYLLKIDVQGAELDVLAGGQAALLQSEFVIIETSFFNFYENETSVADVLGAMTAAGLTLYDIFGLSHRPTDGALAQADLCFVRADGPFRQHHFFATAQQRQEVTRRLNRTNAGIAR